MRLAGLLIVDKVTDYAPLLLLGAVAAPDFLFYKMRSRSRLFSMKEGYLVLIEVNL